MERLRDGHQIRRACLETATLCWCDAVLDMRMRLRGFDRCALASAAMTRSKKAASATAACPFPVAQFHASALPGASEAR